MTARIYRAVFIGGEGGMEAGVVQAACGHKGSFVAGSRWMTPDAT